MQQQRQSGNGSLDLLYQALSPKRKEKEAISPWSGAVAKCDQSGNCHATTDYSPLTKPATPCRFASAASDEFASRGNTMPSRRSWTCKTTRTISERNMQCWAFYRSSTVVQIGAGPKRMQQSVMPMPSRPRCLEDDGASTRSRFARLAGTGGRLQRADVCAASPRRSVLWRNGLCTGWHQGSRWRAKLWGFLFACRSRWF